MSSMQMSSARTRLRVRVCAAILVSIGIASLGTAGLAQELPPAGETPDHFGFGRPPTAEEIRAWDIDVRADGLGLPAGSGTVAQGEATFAQKCAACHGPTGREGPNDRLVGAAVDGFPFGREPTLVRTVGNYWPYATTVYDYIHRAMPLPQPGSLTPDEVYGLVAFILHQNELVGADAVMNAQTLPQVQMPAREHFVEDNRQGGPEIR